MERDLLHSPLGRPSTYISTYSPNLLFPIPRQTKRDELNIVETSLPFYGWDLWNSYEVSWLNLKGKPEVAIAEFRIPCESSRLIESKSFKLYLNSFNQSHYPSRQVVQRILQVDLSHATQAKVEVTLYELGENSHPIEVLTGTSLDHLDIECTEYQPHPNYLSADFEKKVEETLYTHLLKSNCLVTGQPDWGSLSFNYRGPKIEQEGLLKYVISLRDHTEFHEQCVERMFTDILNRCKPESLTIYARYTRRGGLDINPYRSNAPTRILPRNTRLSRQ